MCVYMFKCILLSSQHNIKFYFHSDFVVDGKIRTVHFGSFSDHSRIHLVFFLIYLETKLLISSSQWNSPNFVFFCFYYTLKSIGFYFSFSTWIASLLVNASDTSMIKSNKLVHWVILQATSWNLSRMEPFLKRINIM